jgi:hypothetical protein
MENKVFNFNLNIDWQLINLISVIDRFDSQWTAIERREDDRYKNNRPSPPTTQNNFNFVEYDKQC